MPSTSLGLMLASWFLATPKSRAGTAISVTGVNWFPPHRSPISLPGKEDGRGVRLLFLCLFAGWGSGIGPQNPRTIVLPAGFRQHQAGSRRDEPFQAPGQLATRGLVLGACLPGVAFSAARAPLGLGMRETVCMRVARGHPKALPAAAGWV